MFKHDVTRRQFLKASGLTVAGGILAACGTTGAPTTAPSGGEPTATTAASTGPREGGELRAAFGPRAFENFNPLLNIGGVRVDTNKRVYSTLVQFDNNYAMASDLAEDWDISSDGLTYTFKLREGVTWHDGEPFTAEDVIFTMHLNASTESGSSNQAYLTPVVGATEYIEGQADEISGITAPDDLTVQYQLNSPASSFLANFAKMYILPEHVLGDVAPADLLTHPFMVEAPIGTGPYKLTSLIIDRGMEYARHDNYHLGRPLIETMVWDFIPDADTILLAAEAGDIDYTIGVTWNAANLERIEANENLQVVTAPQPFTSGFLFSHTVEPGWADVRVRQAVAYGINRQEVLRFRHKYSQVNENIFGVEWARHPTLRWSERYPYDPDRARALLEEAGWDPSTTLTWSATGQPSDEVAYLQEQLADLGLNTNYEIVDGPTVVQRLYGDKNSGIYYGGVAWEDPYYCANRWLCSEARPGGLSWSNYCNEEYEAVMEQEAAATNLEERAAAYHRAEEILVEDCVMVPMIWNPTMALFNKRVNVPRYTWYVHDYSWEWWLES